MKKRDLNSVEQFVFCCMPPDGKIYHVIVEIPLGMPAMPAVAFVEMCKPLINRLVIGGSASCSSVN